MSISRRGRNFIASIVLPFLAQAAWLLVYHELQGVAGDAVGPFLYLAPAMAGFACLAIELGGYAILAAPPYFVCMPIALFGFSSAFFSHVFGTPL